MEQLFQLSREYFDIEELARLFPKGAKSYIDGRMLWNREQRI
jgi:hypothetical protein